MAASSLVSRGRTADALPRKARSVGLSLTIALGLLAAGCDEAEKPPAQTDRIVRAMTVTATEQLPAMSFAGRIEPENEPSLSFRINGRISERGARIGDKLQAGDVVARLDPENEYNAVRSRRAALAAAESAFRKAEAHLQRQQHLLVRDVVSQAIVDEAEQRRRAAAAQVEAAKAHLKSAEHVLSFTTLRADGPGVVTATGAEPGEVVAPGRMIVRLAREGGRDAVLELPLDVVRNYADAEFVIALPTDSSVRATGRIREISPQADPVTRLFRVRVGIADSPPAFRIGTSVTGSLRREAAGSVTIPGSALIKSEKKPTVWIIDPKTRTISQRVLEVQSTDPIEVSVSHGLQPGDTVVTAGANSLRQGERVRLIGAEGGPS